MSNLTTDAICAQIDAIQKTANRLVDGVCQQRDEAREVLQAISDCLEYRQDDAAHVQVIQGRGDQFWKILYELKRSNVTPMPSQEDRDEAFDGLKAADLRGDTRVPIKWALTFLDAYLHTGLKLKALDENT